MLGQQTKLEMKAKAEDSKEEMGTQERCQKANVMVVLLVEASYSSSSNHLQY